MLRLGPINTTAGLSFFFFQAEDGIRDYKVTGVQTCALPISGLNRPAKMTPCPSVIDHGMRSTGTPSGRTTSTHARARQACAAEAETVATIGGLSDPRLSARARAISGSGGRCKVCTTGGSRAEARRIAGGSKA